MTVRRRHHLACRHRAALAVRLGAEGRLMSRNRHNVTHGHLVSPSSLNPLRRIARWPPHITATRPDGTKRSGLLSFPIHTSVDVNRGGCDLCLQSGFETSKFWRLWNWLLGVPVAALAAIARFTGLASVPGRVPAAILALIAAVLGGLLTTVEPNKRVRQGQTAGVAYNEVRVGPALRGNARRNLGRSPRPQGNATQTGAIGFLAGLEVGLGVVVPFRRRMTCVRPDLLAW
jgi:hypothetical protein